MRYSIPLQANVPTRQPLRGKCIVILSTGLAASGVTLTLERGSTQDQDSFGVVPRNFSVFDANGDGFTAVTLEATVNATVEVVVTNYDARTRDGDTVTATIDAAQLPLSVDATRGDAPGNPFYVSGVTYTDTPAATNQDNAAVAVAGAAVVVLAAAATRLEARFTNIGTTAVAIGAAGITWAKRAIVLQPGDTWVEQKGAALAWSAITDGTAGGSVTVQELRS